MLAVREEMLAVGELHVVVEEIAPLIKEGLAYTCFPPKQPVCRTHSVDSGNRPDWVPTLRWFEWNHVGVGIVKKDGPPTDCSVEPGHREPDPGMLLAHEGSAEERARDPWSRETDPPSRRRRPHPPERMRPPQGVRSLGRQPSRPPPGDRRSR